MREVDSLAGDPFAAVSTISRGRWGVAVSGGADSIALLELLRTRGCDLTLHVIHLDHETRAGESAVDAQFVHDRAAACGLALTLARRSEIERSIHPLPRNLSARYRAARLELFRRLIRQENLQGVLLAHHADDQAETILQRLLRGSGPAGLTGMATQATIAGVTILRPLLGVRRATLRQWLLSRNIPWREDSSNRSPLQQRNRVRAFLECHPELVQPLIDLGGTCAALAEWLRQQSPPMNDILDLQRTARLCPLIRREALRSWLSRQAETGVEVPPSAVERLEAMILDLATPPRQHFPGGVLVRRRGGRIFVDHGDVAGRDGRVAAAAADSRE